mmetsp:Transcript_46688/g.92181  ORF Transcript_46688/g.92181 Transcript_46688/m.92181 type:complete len:83 (-) Transcript_46688:376-624(-)
MHLDGREREREGGRKGESLTVKVWSNLHLKPSMQRVPRKEGRKEGAKAGRKKTKKNIHGVFDHQSHHLTGLKGEEEKRTTCS